MSVFGYGSAYTPNQSGFGMMEETQSPYRRASGPMNTTTGLDPLSMPQAGSGTIASDPFQINWRAQGDANRFAGQSLMDQGSDLYRTFQNMKSVSPFLQQSFNAQSPGAAFDFNAIGNYGGSGSIANGFRSWVKDLQDSEALRAAQYSGPAMNFNLPGSSQNIDGAMQAYNNFLNKMRSSGQWGVQGDFAFNPMGGNF